MAVQPPQIAPNPHVLLPLHGASMIRRWFNLQQIAGALLAVLLLRCLGGIVAVLTSMAFPNILAGYSIETGPASASFGLWLQDMLVLPWMRYDAVHYYEIASYGYQLERGTAAFHPLYPLLGALVSRIVGGNVPLALLILSTAATVALLVVFTRYVTDCHDPALAQIAGLILLLNPFGCILLIPYTESLFLAFAVGTFWALHRERWWLAGLLAVFATLTRQQGIALLLPVAWSVLLAVRARRSPWWTLAVPALIPAAYLLFIVYRSIVVGDMASVAPASNPIDTIFRVLVSPSADTVAHGQRVAWPWVPLLDELRLIRTQEVTYHYTIDTLAGWCMALIILLGLRWMHTPERLYSLAIIGLSLCYYNGILSPYMALPRHLLLAFPLFIVLAHRLRGFRTLPVIFELMVIAQLGLVFLYVRVGWIP